MSYLSSPHTIAQDLLDIIYLIIKIYTNISYTI